MRKALIPIAFLESSTAALRWGGRLVKALRADLTVLHVAQVHQRGPLDARMAHEKLSQWGIEPPGFQLLRQAEGLLQELGGVRLDEEGRPIERHSFKAIAHGVYEVHLESPHGGHVRLRLRDGQIVAEILREAEDPQYDLILMGTRGHRGLKRYLLGSVAQEVATHAPCSVLVAKNLERTRALLIGATGLPTSHEAARQAAELAQALKLPLKVLAVAPQPAEAPQAQAHAEAAQRVLAQAQAGQAAEVLVRVGDPAEVLIEEAGEEHLLALGRASARLSAVKRFFLGEVSLRVLERCHCPVLIAAPPRPWQEPPPS